MYMNVTQEVFGRIDGQEIYLFTIRSDSGSSIQVSNYGATWVSAKMPDRDGRIADVILGYNDLNGYLSDSNYMGSTIGRFSNRIKNAQFSIGTKIFYLEKNEGENSNHSGSTGFHKKIFDFEVTENGVNFTLFSRDGEGGFPGNLLAKITYVFSDELNVKIDFWAVADKDTYLNITNHAYFNLEGSGNILKHFLQIPSTKILETDKSYIPTGKLIDICNTAFDFSKTKAIGENINEQNLQLIWNRGYNHCYPIVVDSKNKTDLKLAAKLIDFESGRKLQLFTTLPSVLIYSGGFLNSILPGKNGCCYNPFDGICLEPQFYPDSPNHKKFPTCLLRIGNIYKQSIVYNFSTD